MNDSGDITVWLERLKRGDEHALDKLIGLLYEELRGLAQAKLGGERADHTLNATALVNEAYLRLIGQDRIHAGSRTQFMAVAATTMRRVLVDYARGRKRLKRGGGQKAVPLEDVEPFLSDREADEILALDSALDRLAALNPRAATIVEQRFYAGLTIGETAQLIGMSTKTIQREWVAARAWLRKEVAAELRE